MSKYPIGRAKNLQTQIQPLNKLDNKFRN